MLEDGTFGDAEGDGDVADPRGMISVLGEMLSGGFDDAAALRLRTRARGRLALILAEAERGCWQFLASIVTVSHESIPQATIDFNFIFTAIRDSVMRFQRVTVTLSQANKIH